MPTLRPALLPALALALVPAGCWEPNPFFVELEGVASSSGEASSSSGLLPTTRTDTGVATSAMTSDGTSTSGEPTSTTAADGSSGSDGSDSGDGSTGGTPPAYPECMVGADPVCPEPYTECYQYAEPTHSFCTLDCADDMDCPVPTEGTAASICAPMISQCVLDCAGGTTCPTGMECIQVGPGLMFDRCAWPN